MKIRDAVGLLVAAAIPAVMAALGTPVSGGIINTDLFSVLGLSVVFYIFSFAFMVTLGLPAFLLLRKYNLVRWWSAASAGLVVGSIVGIAISLPSSVQIGNVCYTAVVGAVSGLVCWLIVRPPAAA